jgi:hypothetical protein
MYVPIRDEVRCAEHIAMADDEVKAKLNGHEESTNHEVRGPH